MKNFLGQKAPACLALAACALINFDLSSTRAEGCDTIPAGAVSWWPGEGNAVDLSGTNNGILEGGLGFAAGEVNQAFNFIVTNQDVKIPASLSLNVGESAGFTIEAWIKPSSTATYNPIFEWNNGTTWGTHLYLGPIAPVGGAGSLYFNVTDITETNHYFVSPPGTVASGVFNHVAATYDTNSGIAIIYCNGNIVAQQSLGSFIPQTSYDLYLGRRPLTRGESYTFEGLIDEPTVYNRVLASNEIAAIYQAGGAGKCKPVTAPVITSQPVSQSVATGGSVNFAVTATGSPSPVYQWTFNGSLISGATNSILNLANVQFNQAGNYAVTVSNIAGTTNSAVASLTVNSQPARIFFDDFSGPTLNPIWTTNVPDAYCGAFPNGYPTPALYVGAPNYGFQTLDGNSVLRLTNTLAPLQRCGWISSSNFVTGDFRYEARFNTLLQTPATSIDGFIEIWIVNATNSSQYDIISPFGGWYDASPYFFVGSTVDNNFTQTPISYGSNTWYRLVLEGSQGQNIRAAILNDDGSVVAAQNLNHGVSAYGAGFQIALSQSIGGAGSPYPVDVAVDYVSLTSGSAPFITAQPATQAVAVGDTAAFSISAGGSTPLSFQWSFNGAPITGATNTTLVLSNVNSSMSGLYSAEVTNIYGMAFSTSAALTTGSAPIITNQPVSQVVNAGASATFWVGASGTFPLSYQWFYNGSYLIGATNAFLQLTNVQISQGGNYSVQVFNAFGATASSNGVLTVRSTPYFITQPISRSAAAGSSVTFSASVGGSQPLFYKWNHNGTNLPGATNVTLILTNIQPSQAGYYALTASNTFGFALSSNALLTVTGVRPSITSQPVSQIVPAGGTAAFAVTASGTAPLGYQWTFNGANLAGARKSSLVISNVQAGQVGGYAVVVTNAYGSTNSITATLTLSSPLASSFYDDFNGPTLDPIWQTNLPNNAHSGSFPGYSQTATYLGAPQYGFQLLSSNSVLRLTNLLGSLQRRGWDSVTNFGGTNFYYEARYNTMNQSSTSSIDGFIEIWIVDAANSNRYDIVSPFGGSYSDSPYFFSGSSIDNSYGTSSFTYSNNTWYRVVLQSAPGQNIRASIYDDSGTELVGRTFSHDASAFPSGFKIGLSQSVGSAGGTYPVDVAIDHVSLTTTYQPFIFKQPTNQTVAIGTSALFNVVASGAGPLSYQWSVNGASIPGATNASLIISNVQLANAGNYSVAVANTAGSTNSTTASLAVLTPLTIIQQPYSQTVPIGDTANFTVTATGIGPIGYEWLKNGIPLTDGGNITGSSTTNLTITSVGLADAGVYSVILTNGSSTTNSAAATLTVPVTTFSLGSAETMSGATITIPVWMNALGNENAFLASVSYDPAKLSLQAVTGTDLVPVYTYTNNGYVGFAVLLDPGATFPAGTNQVASLVFTALPVTNHTTVNLAFGDYPTGRQVVDNSFDSLTASYNSGIVLLSPAEYEADVYPRTNGDSQVNIFDWIEVGRMVAGLDVPANSDEFARADSAPRNTPDGLLTVADWVQAGRYALGLDPLTLISSTAAPQSLAKAQPMGGGMSGRTLKVGTTSAQRGQTVSVPVQLICLSNENAVGFTVGFNTNSLQLLNVTTGTNATGVRLNVNTLHAGKIGIALAMSPGTVLPVGTNQVVLLQFAVSPNVSGALPLTLDSTLVQLQVADNTANTLTTAYFSGAIIAPPQPSLSIAAADSGLQFTWSVGAGSFQVQSSPQPSGPWTTLVLPLTTNGTTVSTTCTGTNQQQYFRLMGQ